MSNKTKIRKLVRVPTAFVSEETDAAIRALAEAGNRPFSREIRIALEEYVAKQYKETI